jgi:predicted metal-dependent hydrolase
MPSDEQMERLLALLNAHKQKTAPKKPRSKKVIQQTDEDQPIVQEKPKKQTKKQIEAEKEKEIKNKVEQYLKPPAKKPKVSDEPAQVSQETLHAPEEQPRIAPASTPAPPPTPEPEVRAVPAPKVEVQNIQTIISDIQSTIQPSIDEFKIKQIKSFIGSYKNRHI